MKYYNRPKLIKISITISVILFCTGLTIIIAYNAVTYCYSDLASEYLKEKNFAAALAALDMKPQLIALRPEDLVIKAQALMNLAQSEKKDESKLKNYLNAKKYLKEAIDLNSLEANTWHDLALIEWNLSVFNGQEDQVKNIEKYFEHAVKLDPQNGKLLYAIIDYLLVSGEIKNSFPYVESIAAFYPRSYRYLKNKPQWSLINKKFLKGLIVAKKNSFSNYLTEEVLADYYADQKDWKQARMYIESILKTSQQKNLSSIYYKLGEYSLYNNDFELAKNAYLSCLKIVENPDAILNKISSIYVKERAINHFVELLTESAKKNTEIKRKIPVILGKMYYKEKVWKKAKEYLEKALLNEDTDKVHILLARIGLHMGNWEIAANESQRAININSKVAEYYYVLCRAQMNLENISNALSSIEKAILYSSYRKAKYFDYQGLINWKIGRYNEAFMSWKNASRFDAKNISYLIQMSKALEKINDD